MQFAACLETAGREGRGLFKCFHSCHLSLSLTYMYTNTSISPQIKIPCPLQSASQAFQLAYTHSVLLFLPPPFHASRGSPVKSLSPVEGGERPIAGRK